MELKEQLKSDLAAAMREGETHKRDTLRMLLAAIKQIEVDEQTTLDEEAVLSVLTKQAKQRRETIADAEKAGRDALVDQEKEELTFIEAYLPQMMTEDEVRRIAGEVINEVGASNIKDMGRVMGQLMPRLQGQADGRVVSAVVRQLLQG
ncbi:MAG: GatB/YqeY domain-containing protein [Candidatus Promineifilaceae bacterium]